jgi:hypothetical protein
MDGSVGKVTRRMVPAPVSLVAYAGWRGSSPACYGGGGYRGGYRVICLRAGCPNRDVRSSIDRNGFLADN